MNSKWHSSTIFYIQSAETEYFKNNQRSPFNNTKKICFLHIIPLRKNIFPDGSFIILYFFPCRNELVIHQNSLQDKTFILLSHSQQQFKVMHVLEIQINLRFILVWSSISDAWFSRLSLDHTNCVILCTGSVVQQLQSYTSPKRIIKLTEFCNHEKCSTHIKNARNGQGFSLVMKSFHNFG